MLKTFVDRYDPGKHYLPSTPSGPTGFVLHGEPGTRHDVHGGWNYMGVTEHYHAYGEINDCLLHSECGSEGMCCRESAEKFLPPEDLTVTSMQENLVWKYHGEWWCTLNRDSTVFGRPRSFNQFIAMSQYLQSEGVRFIVEANRRRAMRNSGTIIWQFNEPSPNISCSTLVDYYRIPKSAYFGVKRGYAPLNVTLYYRSLVQTGTTDLELWVFNDHAERPLDITLRIRDIRGTVIDSQEFHCIAPHNGSSKIADIRLPVPETVESAFFVELSYNNLSKTFLFSTDAERLLRELPNRPAGPLSVEKNSSGYLVKNHGEYACVGVMAHKDFLLDNGFDLFPGESRLLPTKPGNYTLDVDDFTYINQP